MKLIKFFAILFFDIIDKFIHQKKILFSLRKKIIEIDYFIDVGAHKGTYTDLIIKNFRVKKALMFEPQKYIFKKIKNKYKHIKFIKIFNCAISSENKLQKIYINNHDLTSSLTKLDETNPYLKRKAKLFVSNKNKSLIKETYNIKTVRLNDVIKKNRIKKINLLKIDTEGHELEVLLGLNKSIKHTHFILIEFHRDKIYFNYNPRKIHNYLIKNNFVLEDTFRFPFTYWEDRLYKNKKFK
ncbi:FkbM family methyltransferase [Candidatus Pelagibacter bacterium]|nr:FkbM family methyltransferase [Candidatus Pelagibacter bacterium]